MAKHFTYYARLLQLDPQNQEAKLILDNTLLFNGLNGDVEAFSA